MVKMSLENNMMRVWISGRLDSDSTPEAEARIFGELEQGGFEALCLDLADLQYTSSAGLRLFLRLKKKWNDLMVTNASPAVFDVFHMTGFDEMLNVTPPEGYAYHEDALEPAAAPRAEAPAEAPADAPEIALVGINDTTEDFEYRSVIELFEQQAKAHPDRLAVVTPTERVTYAQLDEMSNRVANYLLLMGVGVEDVIMVLVPRSVNTYVATLGVLKAGAAYTVVHADYPDERIEYIFRDAGCKYMISDRRTVIKRLELVADVLQRRPLYMEEMLSNPAAYSPGIHSAPNDLCYLIYTSGSTGRPKGVMIEHGNLSNFVWPASKNREALGIIRRGTVLLAMAQMVFDVSVMEQYLGLTSGMTVALATEEEILNPSKMRRFMLEHCVDAVCFTPAYANTLTDIPEFADALANVKTYDFGAEAFPGSLFTKLRAINPNAYIMNGYGPTEATISCTMKVIESAEDVTIGRPNANVYAFIVDEALNELPKGTVGELLICGRGVGRGYRNLPDMTRAAFVRFKGMRGYRTGDLARINESDEIEFHGRRDNQVKLRGLRVELDGVEQVIASHPAVRMSAAKVFDNRVLVGYYVLRAPGSVDKAEIEAFARASLAHYMVPQAFVELDEMPMTINRKIDRAALERPEIAEWEIVAPENEAQERLLDIIHGVLPDTGIGTTTNVLELGLSSLDTMLLAARIEEAFDVSVNFSDIAAHPTVLELECLLLSRGRRANVALKETFEAMDTVAFLARELFEGSGASVFNLPYLYALPVSVDAKRLQRAVTQALNAHDGLWARILMRDGRIMLSQRVDHGDYAPQITELSEARFKALKGGLQRPFDAGGLLFRVEIYRTEAAVYLFTDFHHAIIDADSYELLVREILAAYDGEPPYHESYSAFNQHAEAEEYAARGGIEEAVAYYEALFAGAEGCNAIPRDREGGAPIVKRYRRAFGVSPEQIMALARRMKTSPSLLLLGLTAAYNAAVNARRAAYLNTLFNGRNDSRKLRTVGLLTTSFPAFAQWTESTTAQEYFFALQLQLFNSMGIQAQPFVKLLTRHPETFECGFSFLGNLTDDYSVREGRVISEALSPEGTGGSYGIYEEAYEKDGEYWFDVEYRADRYDEATVRRMCAGISAMLRALEPEIMMDALAARGLRGD